MGLLGFFQRKPKCPNCDAVLQAKPTRKQDCPYCKKSIFVRDGELVTEEQATILDWSVTLESFGISRKAFDEQRNKLSKKFGAQASVNDTLWQIFNNLIITKTTNRGVLEQVFREMARLVSSEGKDPTPYLVEAEKIRNGSTDKQHRSKKQVFLGHDELKYVRGLRKEGKLEKAEQLLLKAEPSPAVLDELRKIASARAKAAKKNSDWVAVVTSLESYTTYANEWREYCIKMANQAPPELTESDALLLKEAKEKSASKGV